jgi:dephospho-CoA kinase
MSRERADVVAVGLTGGIGAGKSTALAFFAEAGALTLSADAVVHQLYLREDVRRALVEHFGEDVAAADGEVDRRRVADAVRGRRERLAWLEALIHPLVGLEMRRFLKEAPERTVAVIEAPLLFEAGIQEMFDLVVTVEAGPEARRTRSVQAFDLEQFAELEALQAPTEQRMAGADLAFFNDGHVEHLRAFVLDAYERARSLLGPSAGRSEAGTPPAAGSAAAPASDAGNRAAAEEAGPSEERR